MTDPQVALLMLAMLLFAILLGFPIAFTLVAMGVGFGFYAYYNPAVSVIDNNAFNLLVNQTYSVMSNDVLVAVPLFLFMGYVVERSNIVDRLFFALNIAARHIPASMAVAALATCAMFATAVGIIGAVVTLMGLLALPALLKAGYDKKFASGVICAGGCLGILIPPSIMLIVYSATAGVSVVHAYAAAIFPGFMLAGMYMIYVIGRATLNPSLAPKPPKEQTDIPLAQHLMMLLTSFVPLAVLILSVLGAILFGLATPTEAAAVGSFASLVLAAAYRALTWERLKESVYLTVRTSAMVRWLFVGSRTFSSVFSYLGGHTLIEQFVLGLDLQPWQFLVLGPADIHLSARRQPARCIIAAKLVSVFSYLVAMRRNCLRSQKKFSTRWRHLYIAKSHWIERTRSALGGMTAMAPRLSSSARIQSMSKALSASRASKSIPSINGATPMLSWRWPGSSRKRVRLPSASTGATIFVVSPPRDRPMA